MTFDDLDIVFYNDIDGSCFRPTKEKLFNFILPTLSETESVEFIIDGLIYCIFGNEDGPYMVIIHTKDFEYYKEIYMDAHEVIDWMHYIEGGLNNAV